MIRMLVVRLAVMIAASSFWSGCASQKTVGTSFAPLPEPVTSFGAATSDGYLYVFGGHKGERHDYSAEMVSGSFNRLKLNHGSSWEQLPASVPSQGLPLVAFHGDIYRIGGMAAHNHGGQKQDLYSINLVQRFDPRSKQWEDVTPLPDPRSSHDAAILGNKLYVAGGWQLTGNSNKPVWPSNALVLDLAHPAAGWKEFPQPFQRRALAVAALGSHLVCMGGMDSNNKPTLSVEIYDTDTGQWSKGPDLPPGENKGFSCSAITQGGRIYVNEFQGDLLRLSEDEHSWEVVGRLERPRLAHRLVRAGANQLIALGGEDGDENKIQSLELLTPTAKPMAREQTAAQSTAQAR